MKTARQIAKHLLSTLEKDPAESTEQAIADLSKLSFHQLKEVYYALSSGDWPLLVFKRTKPVPMLRMLHTRSGIIAAIGIALEVVRINEAKTNANVKRLRTAATKMRGSGLINDSDTLGHSDTLSQSDGEEEEEDTQVPVAAE